MKKLLFALLGSMFLLASAAFAADEATQCKEGEVLDEATGECKAAE
ncbi:MAG: hypothetical protein ACT4NU_08565 [Chromatiales bacterium]